jgi:hypothetical protein
MDDEGLSKLEVKNIVVQKEIERINAALEV